ncbi:MAG: glycosyltransferase family 39 protein [Thermosynechococcaceae cyanobacterium]
MGKPVLTEPSIAIASSQSYESGVVRNVYRRSVLLTEKHPHSRPRGVWRFAILAILVLGICFRFANLEYKVYWFDEVSTAIRVAGHTKGEVEQQFVIGGATNAPALQQYSTLQPQTTWQDTWSALKRSPEQAPLYYLLARGWTQIFGSSVLAIRALSAVLSLLALPCMYWLGLELFETAQPTWILVMLLSLSPFYVAYAQEARPYSLWAATILFSSMTCLRAMRLNTKRSWLLYGISTALGFYTSLLSALVTLGHGLYVLRLGKRRRWAGEWLSGVAIATLLFSPWLWIILTRIGSFQDNTVWMRSPMQISSRILIWIAPILLTFGDLPYPTDAGSFLEPGVILGLVVAVFLLSLTIYAARFIYSQSKQKLWLFPLTLGLTTPVALILLDLLQSGQSSASPRYMIPVQVAIQLVVAYLLAYKIASSESVRSQRRWIAVLVLLLGVGLLSCTLNLERSPVYQKSRNLDNIPIAKVVNEVQSAILMAEPANALDLISLSYSLDPDIQIYPWTDELSMISKLCGSHRLFLFNPSNAVQEQIQGQSNLKLAPAYKPKRLIASQIVLSLWSVESRQTCPVQE